MRTRRACKGDATVYYTNGSNPAVGQWFAQHYLWLIKKNSNTVMFQDDSNARCRIIPGHWDKLTPVELTNSSGCDVSLANALRTTANQIRWPDGAPVASIVNGFPVHRHPFESANFAASTLIAPGSQIIGGVEEAGEIFGNTYTPQVVSADVNTASLVYAANPDALYGFYAASNADPGSTDRCVDASDNTESCGALQLRRNTLGSFWLAYIENHTFLWENFTFSGNACCGGPRALAVYPEASLYPTSPVQPLKTFDPAVPTTNGTGCGPKPGRGGIQSFVVACGTLNDGKTPAGIYVREFRRCFSFGRLIGLGQCAVVMNTTNTAVTPGNWFTKSYTRSMTWGSGPTNGGDVLTAGCGENGCPKSAIDPFGSSFSPKTTQVPAFDTLFLFHD
jgi:hypothetical protein